MGARPTVPAMKGLDSEPYLTSTSILDLEEFAEHLIVIGGGYVGLEFAQMFRRFGSEVTVIDTNRVWLCMRMRIRPRQFARYLHRKAFNSRLVPPAFIWNDVRISLLRRWNATKERHMCSGRTSTCWQSGERPIRTTSKSRCRREATTDDHGFVSVDDELHTSVPGIFALGDCWPPGFTHTSYNDLRDRRRKSAG